MERKCRRAFMLRSTLLAMRIIRPCSFLVRYPLPRHLMMKRLDTLTVTVLFGMSLGPGDMPKFAILSPLMITLRGPDTASSPLTVR